MEEFEYGCVGNPGGKRPLGKPRCRWEDIKVDLNPLNVKLNSICHLLVLLGAHLILYISRIRVKEPCWEGVDWKDVAQDGDKWRAVVKSAINVRVP